VVPIYEGLPGILVSKEPLHVDADLPVKVIANDPEPIKIHVHEAIPVKVNGNESKIDKIIVKESELISANEPSSVLVETDEALVVTNEAQPSPNEIFSVLTAMSSVADKNHGK
jgi:ribosomal protein L14